MNTKKTATLKLNCAQVLVCIGCCCGRVDRGRSEVPIDTLKALWKDYGLRKKVQLTVTECLGPCDMHNVAMLMTEGEQIWIGKLKEQAHFEAIAEWASNVIQIGSGAKLPEFLEPHCFKRWESDN